MKFLLFLITLSSITVFGQVIDTVVFKKHKMDSIEVETPAFDTSLYMDIQFGTVRIDNEMYADEFVGQERMVFVNYSRKERKGYHFIRGEMKDIESGKIGLIAEKGILSEEIKKMLTQAKGQKFYMVIEFIDPEGEHHRRKSIFRILPSRNE